MTDYYDQPYDDDDVWGEVPKDDAPYLAWQALKAENARLRARVAECEVALSEIEDKTKDAVRGYDTAQNGMAHVHDIAFKALKGETDE